MTRPHDPAEGEYTDSELPLDAEVPDTSTRNDAARHDEDDDVIVDERDVEVIEFVDPERADRTQL